MRSQIPPGQQEVFKGPIYGYRIPMVTAQAAKGTAPVSTADTALPWVQEGQQSPQQIHGAKSAGPFSPPLSRLTAFAGPGPMEIEVCDDGADVAAFLSAPLAATAQLAAGQALIRQIFPVVNALQTNVATYASQRALVGNDVGYMPANKGDGFALNGARRLRVFFNCVSDGVNVVTGLTWVPWLLDGDVQIWVPQDEAAIVLTDQTGFGVNVPARVFDLDLDETKPNSTYPVFPPNVPMVDRLYLQPVAPNNANVVKVYVNVWRLE
jgi:hypothetical protein